MSGGGGHVNANRKHNPDPPVHVCIKFPESVWAEIDAIRGAQPRTKWLLDAAKAALYYEGKASA